MDREGQRAEYAAWLRAAAEQRFGAGRAQVSHPGSHGIPAALIRGGQSVLSIGFAGSSAGVFSVDGLFFPSDFFPVLGFRCAR